LNLLNRIKTLITNTENRKKVICFKQWSRKNYAIFFSLGKEIQIKAINFELRPVELFPESFINKLNELMPLLLAKLQQEIFTNLTFSTTEFERIYPIYSKKTIC